MLDIKNTDIKIDYESQLRDFTTFRLGNGSKGLIHCQAPDQVQAVVLELNKNSLPFILIGGGSNLVVSDKPLNCFVIRYVSDKPIIQRNGTEFKVSGGTILDQFVSHAAHLGFEGINYASGIPGTVAGAVVGNAGAFGRQIGDVLSSAVLLTKSGEKKAVTNKDLRFAYRYSALKESGDIVLEVTLQLNVGNKEDLLKQRQEWLNLRKERHPDPKTYPCAGSFFRNIEPTSKADKRQAAAWYLEQAGAFDLSVGGALVFHGHANMIVNKDNQATAQDVYELSKNMMKIVDDKFSLKLVREVQLVGDFKGMPVDKKGIVW